MKIISTDGIVVSSIPFKESSRIINILTKDMGIVGCIVKGCKSLKSKLRLPSEKFAYGTFHFYYKENGLSTLIEADIKNYFINIKSDIVKISYMSYLCELATNVYKESNNSEVYDILISALLKIEDNFDPKIITNIVEIQYLNYIGISLCLDSCVNCGSTKVVTLSTSRGGYLCADCRNSEPILDGKILKLLRLYNYVDISKISNLDIDSEVSNAIDRIISEYYEDYSGVSTKSKKFLKEIE